MVLAPLGPPRVALRAAVDERLERERPAASGGARLDDRRPTPREAVARTPRLLELVSPAPRGTARAGGGEAATRAALDAALRAAPARTAGAVAPAAAAPTDTPEARAAADAARIRERARTDPAGAAEELERCVADHPDPAYRAALLASPDTQAALEGLGGALLSDRDTADRVAASLARTSTTLRASGDAPAAQGLARTVAAGLTEAADRTGSAAQLQETVAATVEGGGADFVADLTVALAETDSAHSAATQRVTRAVATGLAQGVDRLGRELDERTRNYDDEVRANASQAARYDGPLDDDQRAAAADAAQRRTSDRAAQADASGEAYYRAVEAAARARDALHHEGKADVADRHADLDGVLAASAPRLDDLSRFPRGAAAVGATLRREQAGERTLVDALDGFGLDAEAEAQVFAGLLGGAAFNGAQDQARGGSPAAAADQVRDLGGRFLPPGTANEVDRVADRVADGSLLTPEGLADLERLRAHEPFASNPTLCALLMGVSGASVSAADLVEGVRSGRLPASALQATAMLMGMVAIAAGDTSTSTAARTAGATADTAAAAASAAGASGAAGWLRGLGKALGGAANVAGFLEAAASGDHVGAALGLACVVGMLPGLGPVGWIGAAGCLVLGIGRYIEDRIEREQAEVAARARFLRDAGVPCADELSRLPDGGVAVLERVRASGPHADLEAAIRAEIAAEYQALAIAAAVAPQGI